jgi:tight adherence protein B
MATFAPMALLFGFFGGVALAVILYWNKITEGVAKYLESYASQLERAAIPVKRDDVARQATIVLGAVVIIWGAFMFFARPGIWVGLLALVILSAIVYIGARVWIAKRIEARLIEFNNQLELVIRLVVSALRVGLGLRQAISMVVSEMPPPASVEFTRVMMQTTIGVSMDDAMDQLAVRMPSAEIIMMVKTIKIQSQTGGNLAKILMNLSEMIKQRRRIDRRIKALTAESTSTKYIVTALPVGVSIFIMIFEPPMRQALLGTHMGWLVLGVAATMLGIGWVLFDKLSALDL